MPQEFQIDFQTIAANEMMVDTFEKILLAQNVRNIMLTEMISGETIVHQSSSTDD